MSRHLNEEPNKWHRFASLAVFVFVILFVLFIAVKSAAQDNRPRRTDQTEPSKTASKQQTPTEPETLDVIKIDANLVNVPVIVSDRQGRYVPNLTVTSFKLFDNNHQQTIVHFEADEEPLNVALLLDTSHSTEKSIDDIKKAAKNFIKELRPQDRALIISFDYDIHHLSELTNDRKHL